MKAHQSITACAAVQSLNTEFCRSIRKQVTKAIKEYALIAPRDRIAICISGGKDSMLLAVVLREIQKHGEIPFYLEYIAMDPGYSLANRKQLQQNAAALDVPLHIFETNVFRVAQNHAKNPCFLCAKMRRGWLYSQAQLLKCNKIALGHHYDDVVETILMAMLYGGQIQSMLPKLPSAHYPGMEVIRPLFLVQEENILAWSKQLGLQCLDCACTISQQKETSTRASIKKLLVQLSETNPQIKQNILNSVKNIDLKHILGYHIGDVKRTFLDDSMERTLE